MKEPIADVYERQYQELLDKIGKKVFREKKDLSNFFFEYMENKEFNSEEIIKIMIGNFNIVKNCNIQFIMPYLSFIVFCNNEEYKRIRCYDVDIFRDELIEVYKIIKQLLQEKSMIYNLWIKETIYTSDKLVDIFWNIEGISKKVKEYENSAFKFVNIPKWIERNKIVVNDYINNNNFFDNQNWEYFEQLMFQKKYQEQKEQNNGK